MTFKDLPRSLRTRINRNNPHTVYHPHYTMDVVIKNLQRAAYNQKLRMIEFSYGPLNCLLESEKRRNRLLGLIEEVNTYDV